LLSRLAGEAPPLWSRQGGTVTMSGALMRPSDLAISIGFVRQDDAMSAALTVRENLEFAAALRSPIADARERRQKVAETLEKLGLTGVAKSRLGGARARGVSGGERRRAAVGMELLGAHRVLILDEPTSGLDDKAAESLCKLLADLALEGHSILASLHQPKDEVLAHFPDMMVMGSRGRVAYQGPTSELTGYVSKLINMEDRPTCSASDLILDAISQGFEEIYKAHAPDNAKAELSDMDVQSSLRSRLRWSTGGDGDSTCFAPPMPPLAQQIVQLVWREARITFRERGLAVWHYASAAGAGLLLGFADRSLQLNLVGVISRIGLFFVLQCILGMQALQSLVAWRDGHTAFLRERAAGYYGTFAYVLAKVLVDGIILRVGPPVLLGTLIYHYVELHEGRIVPFLTALSLCSWASSCFCLWIGSMSPRSAVGLPFAVLMLLLFLLFGGVLVSGAPLWLTEASYFGASYNIMVRNEFEGLTFKFDPKHSVRVDDIFVSGELFMSVLRIKDIPVSENIFKLVAFCSGFAVLSWLSLAIPAWGWQLKQTVCSFSFRFPCRCRLPFQRSKGKE